MINPPLKSISFKEMIMKSETRPDPNTLWGFALMQNVVKYRVDGAFWRLAAQSEIADAHFTVWDDDVSGPCFRQGFVKV